MSLPKDRITGRVTAKVMIVSLPKDVVNGSVTAKGHS